MSKLFWADEKVLPYVTLHYSPTIFYLSSDGLISAGAMRLTYPDGVIYYKLFAYCSRGSHLDTAEARAAVDKFGREYGFKRTKRNTQYKSHEMRREWFAELTS